MKQIFAAMFAVLVTLSASASSAPVNYRVDLKSPQFNGPLTTGPIDARENGIASYKRTADADFWVIITPEAAASDGSTIAKVAFAYGYKGKGSHGTRMIRLKPGQSQGLIADGPFVATITLL